MSKTEKSMISKEEKSRIESICKRYEIINNYTINDDGIVDVNGDVSLINMDLKEIEINFGTIIGNFACDFNPLLKSLKGCPKIVTGEFSMTFCNTITSLEYCPTEVGFMRCSNNALYSLQYFPTKLKGFNIRDAFDKRFQPLGLHDISKLSIEDQLIYFKYQDYYNVWTGPEGFDHDALKELLIDIKDGLL